ncbi:MAG TPA: NAD(P)-dependent oxidoreductase [Gaiellaceae bacterium]|nr:NAD(P)-dependent oxidoreductase [Gaiellaceae bacterium]
MSGRRFLVTGSAGCIGAWVVHELVDAGESVTMFDLSTDARRPALLLDPDRLAQVPSVAGDIADLAALEQALDEHEITNVIHLAALQVPFCRADPPLGARVNVLGTVNVFEAVARRLERMAPVVYASSVAAFDAPEDGKAPGMDGHPGTIYGVFKRANESTAAVYRAESGVPSIGLRPHTVYGVGRDQGLTSAPTTAMLAAAAGVPYTIPYGGSAQLQLAADVARAFIGASLSGSGEATVHNLPGPKVSVTDVIAAIEAAVPASAGSIGSEDVLLPFPEEVDSASFDALVPGFAATPLAEGVRSTVERFRALLADGRVSSPIPQAKAVQ